MTATPFAALEARLNAAVFARLSNATMYLDWDTPVSGIFDNRYAQPLGAIGASMPTFTVATAAVPGIAQGQALSMPTGTDGESLRFTVRSVEPDGTGMTVLTLSAAS